MELVTDQGYYTFPSIVSGELEPEVSGLNWSFWRYWLEQELKNILWVTQSDLILIGLILHNHFTYNLYLIEGFYERTNYLNMFNLH